eukprot:scaffold83_cov57-Cyclotella_meneghiniana.AAC.4
MAPKELRGYQKRIVETAISDNVIVLLPTGSGKTLIAAEAISRLGHRSIFFVPTIPLVAQQAAAVRSHTPSLNVGEFNGERSLPNHFDVLVTAPKAFEVAPGTWKFLPFHGLTTKSVVFDESPGVIGLTASLTYAVGNEKINKSIGKLCQEFNISKIEGYTGAGRGAIAEVRLPDVPNAGNLVPLQDRKPHLMHKTFFDRIQKGNATSFSTELVAVIRVIEDAVKLEVKEFKTPLLNVSVC